VVCFETLEHVPDPAAALGSIRTVLDGDGLLIGSVPGETDWTEDNEFHLQHFNRDKLAALVGAEFRHYRLYLQRFHLGSLIEPEGAPSPEVVRIEEKRQMRLDFGHAPDWADTWLFLASQEELPETGGVPVAFSRQAWLNFSGDSGKAAAELQRIMGRFRELFFLHGDLKRRFTNVLSWGQYNHSIAQGKDPEKGFQEKIEEAQSAREQELRQELERLRAEIDKLRREALQAGAAGDADSRQRRDRFMEGLKS